MHDPRLEHNIGDSLGKVEGDEAALAASLIMADVDKGTPTESKAKVATYHKKTGQVTKSERDMAVVLLEQLSLTLPSLASSSDKVRDHSQGRQIECMASCMCARACTRLYRNMF